MSPARSVAPPWDAVLFDLDGTLANTIPLILACYRHAMSVHRPGDPVDEVWIRSQIGRTLKDTMAEFSTDPEAADAFRATYSEKQDELHDEMVSPYVGALGHVERYVQAGTPRAIVTSKGRIMALRTMGVCALDVHFEHLISADDVTKGKPDPEPVRIALDRLGVAPGPRVAFVGDSPWDIASGKAAGVTTIAVGWGAAAAADLEAAGADHLVTRFSELVRIEEELGR